MIDLTTVTEAVSGLGATMLISFACGAAGAFFVSRIAPILGLMDRPGNRSSHTVPTPRGGGVGILVATVLGSVVLQVDTMFWAPACAVAIISLVGDRFELSPALRLVFQLSAAFLVVVFGPPGLAHAIPDGLGSSGALLVNLCLILFSTVFITGTANFYNFMDGINGMAAITGIVAFSMVALWGISSGLDRWAVAFSMSVAASCAGFLPFNMPRARVFMGDVGSVLLGFLFASLVLVMAGGVGEFILLSSFLFPFYADELATMRERIIDGERLTSPHRRHLYQVLANEAGIPHWKVSISYGVLQVLVAITCWLAYDFAGVFWATCIALVWGVLFILVNNRIKARYRHET